MYMAYGWPQVIPLEQGLCPSAQKIVYLKVINRTLLVVSPTHFELWSTSQHRVRLGKYKRDSDSLQREGENLQAVWSPDAKLIAIITSSFFLHIFKVQLSDKRIHTWWETTLCFVPSYYFSSAYRASSFCIKGFFSEQYC
ncbi:RIC1 like [Spatholobus suberectus]|nr:RIC1 like [Spatholobus suberectus]